AASAVCYEALCSLAAERRDYEVFLIFRQPLLYFAVAAFQRRLRRAERDYNKPVTCSARSF
ncbi:hypothetical protein, partial [Massilia aurea]|uniref:hypothetical protein n=1 Tax=Massilia aurea TaxID=373040 RepID=UPI001C8657EA